MLERVALTRDAVVIYCDPGFDHIRETFLSRSDDEYLDNVKQLEEVYARYPGRLKQSHLPVLTYNFKEQSVDDVLKFIRSESNENPFTPSQIGIGSGEADIVLVGDTFANHTQWDCHQQFPFVSFGKGCSQWLASQMDKHRIPENKLWWMNQDMLPADTAGCKDVDTIDYLVETQHVIALGDNASKKLDEWSIPHYKHYHPAYWSRFRTEETKDSKLTDLNKTYPLMTLLEELTHALSYRQNLV